VGEVHTSALRRWLYSTDASGYRVVPDVVLVAGSTDDLIAAASVAAEHGMPLVVRGAGTSLAGQAIGPGIMVDCFKLDHILALDPEAATARVEPGVIQASLNRAAASHGLVFGPDTATIDQATIGGMVGNNSSGSRSIVYGESRDKVRRIAAVLPGGDAYVFGASRGGELLDGIRPRDGALGLRAQALAADLAAIRGRYGATIAHGFPDVRRCTSGYNLRELLEPQPNLGRLLAGSEGTLALFTELEVTLDRLPAARLGAAITFADLRAALVANVAILETGPSAVELLDLDPLRRAPNLRTFASLASLLDGDEQALLIVEYQGDDEEAREGLGRLSAALPGLDAVHVRWLDTPAGMAAAAALRRAMLPLLMGAPGVERPASVVEDTAVAPERLADFVGEFQRLVRARGLHASFSGHASAGCLHIHPLLDLKSAAGVEHLGILAGEVAALVAAYHGVISGEHGCGRARSCLLPTVLGGELYAAMVAVKDAFDPSRLLGPGIVVDAAPVTEGLRFGVDYRADGAWTPRLSHAPEGGFGLAIEKCFGAGLCKKLDGTMCPPAAVDRDEARSTRARANALQGILCGAIALDSLSGAEFREVLGSCVACKACRTECPAGVDMAALKVEWLAEVRARHGVPALGRGIGEFRWLAALASAVAPAANAAAQTRAARFVADRLGVAHARPLPAFARRPLTRRLPRDGAGRPRAAGSAVLFVDCFVQYQEPQVGESLAALLRSAGTDLALLDAGCCGRTALSTGQIEKARTAAQRALGPLHDRARAGADLLFIEPSCLSMIRDDWARLLPGDARVAAVAAAARPALALVADLADAGRLRFLPGGHALLHSHCHEKALGFAAATERALRTVPELHLEILDAGCCGMSGVFGYEAEHYDLSVAMAERVLLPAVRAVPPATTVLATGTSCRTQIGDLTARDALHPLEFLAQRLAAGPPAARRRPSQSCLAAP
jgi:FAD/FMN-containing dehydrogenase/Fe-S oxidoreductase